MLYLAVAWLADPLDLGNVAVVWVMGFKFRGLVAYLAYDRSLETAVT